MLRNMAKTPTPDESEELKAYRAALESEFEKADPTRNPVAAAKKARAELLGLVPEAIAALKATLLSCDNDRTRVDVAKYIIGLTIGEKAKVVMPKGMTEIEGMDELELIYAELGAEKENIPRTDDH